MKLPRRKFMHLAAGAAALPVVSRIESAEAQDYPAKPVRIISSSAGPVFNPRCCRHSSRNWSTVKWP